jgi:hypothetical protein
VLGDEPNKKKNAFSTPSARHIGLAPVGEKRKRFVLTTGFFIGARNLEFPEIAQCIWQS